MRTTYSGIANEYSRSILIEGAALDFTTPEQDEIDDARRMASRLMQCDVAPRNTFERVLGHQPGAMLVRRQDGRVAGVVAMLLLKGEAETQLLSGRFDGFRPGEDVLARGDDRPTAYYIWGVAAETKLGRWASVELSRRLRFGALKDLPGYMTAATDDGRRGAMRYLGFQAASSAPAGLMTGAPIVERRAA